MKSVKGRQEKQRRWGGGQKSIRNITNDCAKNSINYAYYLLSLSSNKCFIISPARLMLATFTGGTEEPRRRQPTLKPLLATQLQNKIKKHPRSRGGRASLGGKGNILQRRTPVIGGVFDEGADTGQVLKDVHSQHKQDPVGENKQG